MMFKRGYKKPFYPPTEKQLDFIERIEEVTGVPFVGTTKKEASEYIDEMIDEYNDARLEENQGRD